MPKQPKPTADKSGLKPVSEVVKHIEALVKSAEVPVKKERKKVILSPEDAEKRRAILCERLKKARAVKAERKAANPV